MKQRLLPPLADSAGAWTPRRSRGIGASLPAVASHQTSQVVDPPDGRIPALTPEAQAKLDAKMKLRRDPIPASYTNWSYYDRCITRGVAGSILPVIYGNGLEIVQTPGYVAIRYEMVHDVRLIPTDGRPHVSSNIRSYMGDAVGHWEGKTLVVETTNLLGDRMAVGVNGDGGAPYSEDMKLTERFTRVAPNVIDYRLTVDDPKDLYRPVDGRVPDHARTRIQAFRIRLPRRQHGHAQHAEHCSDGRREEGRRRSRQIGRGREIRRQTVP